MNPFSHARIFGLCLISVLALCAGLVVALAGDAVQPERTAGTWLRGESVRQLGDVAYYRGTTLLLTNCVCYTGTSTGSDVQGLDGVSIELRIGSEGGTNNTLVAGAVSAGNTNWYATITIPDTDDTYLQLAIVDENTNRFVYPWKVIKTKTSMQ